ncbi:MAG: glycosyltransferase family 2 protein [Candidatus Omnitrophica bacterium]|nr:glycosyltransferase family 2 protein [Candidatus Omnitrophota bacterium]
MISIVIPAYNETGRIGKTLQSIRRYVTACGSDYEVIVSDDGSTDGTCELVQKEAQGLNYRLLRGAQNKGKGHAVRWGMLAAQGDIVLFTDADLSTPIEELEKIIPLLDSGVDVVIGSRALPQSDVQVHQNFIREGMGKIFNWFARVLVFRGVRDSQCGFKAFRKEAAQRLFSQSKIDGFCFDAEIVYLAQKNGCRLIETPVVWKNDPQSKVHIFSSPWEMFLDLFKIRWLHRND